MYVLLVEYVGKRHRHVIGTTLWYFWVLSLMLLPLFAYLIRDWRTLSIAGAVPGLFQIIFWWWVKHQINQSCICLSHSLSWLRTLLLIKTKDRRHVRFFLPREWEKNLKWSMRMKGSLDPLLDPILSAKQSRSQSPRYPCPAVERPTRTSGIERSAWPAQ